MTYGSLFSGIGGLDLGLDQAGLRCLWQVENDPYATAVLEKHWPDVRRYRDVTTVSGADLEDVDVLAGGFPCQDISHAGGRLGLEGKRSGLWSEFSRLIGELRPRYVLVENVAGMLKNEVMGTVLGDLSTLGYDAEWQSLQASDFGLPHCRKRIFVVAYPNPYYGRKGLGDELVRTPEVFVSDMVQRDAVRVQAPDQFARGDDGLPSKFYRPRVGGLGNAVAVDCGRCIGQLIMRHSKYTEKL